MLLCLALLSCVNRYSGTKGKRVLVIACKCDGQMLITRIFSGCVFINIGLVVNVAHYQVQVTIIIQVGIYRTVGERFFRQACFFSNIFEIEVTGIFEEVILQWDRGNSINHPGNQ